MKKETIILIVIIAALAAYILFEKSDKTHYTLPELSPVNKEEITRLQIIRKGEKDSELTLQREGDRWLILPEKYPADSTAVNNMADNIASMALTTLVSEAKNYTIYDLDEDKKIEASIYKGDTLLRKVDIGKTAPSYRHTFVRLPEDDHVYHAEKNFRIYFDKDKAALRDKQILKFEDDISEIMLTADKETLHIVRSAAPVDVDLTQDSEVQEAEAPPAPPKWQTKEGKTVKEKEIDELVKTLSNIMCDGFVEGKKKEDLKDPSFTISLKGITNYELSLYDQQDKKFVATSSQSDYPFLLPEWRAKKIKVDLKDLTEE